MPRWVEPQSVQGLLDKYASGELTPSGYLETLEARIDLVEPFIQSLMAEPGRFDRLRGDAARLEAAYPDPNNRPPLYGVPVGVKDIFRVDGLPTTAGSRLPTELFDGAESHAVTQLKNAGAMVLGKTVSTEFAYFGPGPTQNPWEHDRTPGGSSSGSAAAVSAGVVPLSFGTQTIGSISRPASYCGVVGYKPTYDRISREGVIPLAPSLDHVGVFASRVAGVELAASCLCAGWSAQAVPDKLVVGIPKGPILKKVAPPYLHHLKRITDVLAARGFEIVVVPAMADFEEIERRHRQLVAAEAAQVHSSWYADYGSLYHPKTVALLEQGRQVSEDDVAAALAGREKLRSELTGLMKERGVDVWILPAAQDVAPAGLDSTGDPVMNLPWSHCGLPTVTIPCGFSSDGLPWGLQIAAGWNQDERLFRWAAMIEFALAKEVA